MLSLSQDIDWKIGLASINQIRSTDEITMHRPCRWRMFDRHKLGVRGFVLIPLEIRSYLHPPQQTFPLSPFSGFTLSAGHKTIAPSRHRMAHVKHRPGEADILANTNTSHRRQIPLPPVYEKQWAVAPRSFHLHACMPVLHVKWTLQLRM
jgi:hypothetical protein